ncbi:MAG: hypothetical protein IPO87_07205 [Flavobacteriales bacterium]|nr:hypothetical protein [Flavobacteriales bacterium]HQW41616.1 hypothetical protein [Flavobacteriales bacterium]
MRHLLTLPLLLLYSATAAQTTCDSLRIDSVWYAPFGDGLQISLFNESMQFLSGPTLDLIDAQGDTLVHGILEFFGIFQGPSVHQLQFTPQPETPYTGTVVVNYSDGNGEMHCDLALSGVDLCPPSGCLPAEVFAYQQGGNPVPMELVWSVTDAGNNTVNNGVLQMDSTGFGFLTTGVCLLPGTYTLHMEQPEPAGTSIHVGMTQAGFAYTDGVIVQLTVGGSVDLPFDYYRNCVDGAQGIAQQQVELPTLIVDGQSLRITSGTNLPLGKLLLLDAMGRVVQRSNNTTNSAILDISGCAGGSYILRPSHPGHWPAQRLILP